MSEENRLGPLKLRRRYEADDSYWIVRYMRPKIIRAGIILTWRGFPKDYEVAFAKRMNELDREGLHFSTVLRETLPRAMGKDPAEVLRHWVGPKSNRSPIKFVKSVNKMFGPSAKPLIISIGSMAGNTNAEAEETHESVLAFLAKQVETWGEAPEAPRATVGSHA